MSSKSAAVILYEQCRCMQELHSQTILYYNQRLKILFRIIIAVSIVSTLGLFVTSVILHINITGGISYIIPAMFAGLMTLYRVRQNEYGLVERSAIVASLQSILMEVDLIAELSSLRLETLLSEYRRIISNYTHFPPHIESRLISNWLDDNIAIPEFLQTRISSAHMTANQLHSLDPELIHMIRIESDELEI